MKLHKLKPQTLKTELTAILFLEGIKLHEPTLLKMNDGSWVSVSRSRVPKGMIGRTYTKTFYDEVSTGFSSYVRVVSLRWSGTSVFIRNNRRQYVDINSHNFMTPLLGEFIDETRKPGFFDKFDKTSYQTLTIELEEDIHYRELLRIIRTAISNLITT